LRNASSVASVTFSLANAGMRDSSFSIGAPTMLASFIASAGLSS
jgi:ATP phosphoribosyltransferase regulatory subunit HisZ